MGSQVNSRERQALKGKWLTQQGSPSFGGRNSLACRSSSLDSAVFFFSLVPIPEHRLWKQKPHQPEDCEQSLQAGGHSGVDLQCHCPLESPFTDPDAQVTAQPSESRMPGHGSQASVFFKDLQVIPVILICSNIWEV